MILFMKRVCHPNHFKYLVTKISQVKNKLKIQKDKFILNIKVAAMDNLIGVIHLAIKQKN